MGNENVLVLGWKGYTGTIDGKEINSCKVSYVSSFRSSDIKNGSTSIGYLPIQVGVEPDVKSSLKEIPGIYKPIYTLVPGTNNKPIPKLVGMEFVKPVDFKDIFK